jgi:hypothetical protein
MYHHLVHWFICQLAQKCTNTLFISFTLVECGGTAISQVSRPNHFVHVWCASTGKPCGHAEELAM